MTLRCLSSGHMNRSIGWIKKAGAFGAPACFSLPDDRVGHQADNYLFKYVGDGCVASGADGFFLAIQAVKKAAFTRFNLRAQLGEVVIALAGYVVQCRNSMFQLR